jgi:hypothetical protein
VATALMCVPSAPASADVIVNNIFSPFSSTTVIVPGYRSYGHSTYWINNPYHHQRCYRRWDPYFGEWQWNCVRMHYHSGGPYYQGYRPYWD